MKTMTRKACVKLYILMVALATSGCNRSGSYDYNPYPNIHIEETVHLGNDEDSPYCDFSMEYSYLNEKGDSISILINQSAQRELLGHDYADLIPEAAVDSFKNTYLRNYRTEVGGIYQADVDKNGTENTPEWYSRTYSLVTFVEEGTKGTLLMEANYYEDTAGAHPNQWSRWLNFDILTGKLLTKDEVFESSGQADIERMLFDNLMLRVAQQYPEENLKSLEDLQQKGYLQMTDIYIPDNFLLSKKGVLFLFNRYDIAPYSAGEIVLEVPYEEIGQWIKNWK